MVSSVQIGNGNNSFKVSQNSSESLPPVDSLPPVNVVVDSFRVRLRGVANVTLTLKEPIELGSLIPENLAEKFLEEGKLDITLENGVRLYYEKEHNVIRAQGGLLGSVTENVINLFLSKSNKEVVNINNMGIPLSQVDIDKSITAGVINSSIKDNLITVDASGNRSSDGNESPAFNETYIR